MRADRQARLQQRWQLEQQSAELRERLVAHAQALAPVWTMAERTRQGANWVKRHPWLPLVAVGLLLWRRPRRVVQWGARLWALRGTAQRVLGWWHILRGARSSR